MYISIVHLVLVFTTKCTEWKKRHAIDLSPLTVRVPQFLGERIESLCVKEVKVPTSTTTISPLLQSACLKLCAIPTWLHTMVVACLHQWVWSGQPSGTSLPQLQHKTVPSTQSATSLWWVHQATNSYGTLN